MDRITQEFGTLSEATVFLDDFKDLPDPRQRGKIIYPLPRCCCCVCSRCWVEQRRSSILRGSERKSSAFYAGSGHFAMEPRNIDERLCSTQHREQTQQQHLGKRVDYFAALARVHNH